MTTTFGANEVGTYVVPANVTRLVATVAGGAGGLPGETGVGSLGGNGALVTSTLPVSEGDSFSAAVGQVGIPGVGGESGGNPSGGGASQEIPELGPGGGGGGASFVTKGATLQIAAGGGGGGGRGASGGSSGGNAASVLGQQSAGTILSGGNGVNANTPSGGFGGGGGSATPGAAGANNRGFPSDTASPGVGEVGGAGSGPDADGGGGGGGFAGGGGGGLGGWSGGGGAGSSYGIDAYSVSAHGGDGSVAFSYEFPALTSATAVTLPALHLGSFTVCTTAVPVATIVKAGALPSGVSFVDNGDGTASLSGTPTSGSEGLYPLTFTAANGNGSDAVQSFTLTVSKNTPVVSLTAAPATSTFGNPVTFTATVNAGTVSSPPTGTVHFQNNGSSINAACDAAVVSTTAGVSTATCSTSSLGLGSNPIAATYSGDIDDTGGGIATYNDVVTKTTPGVNLSTSSNPSVFGQSVTATAAITPSSLAGSVQFAVNGTNVGSPVVVSSGSAQSQPLTLAGNPLPGGNTAVSATFTPTDTSDFFNGVASIQQVVSRATTAVSLVSSPSPSVHGQSATATATITPSNLAGSVQFAVNGANVGSPVAVSSGSAQSATLTDAGGPLPAADNSVSATFTPTDTTDYLTSSASIDQIVATATPVVSLSASPSSSTFGVAVTFTAEVDRAPGGSAPTGTVAFQDNGSSIKTACDAATVSTTAGVTTATCTTSALGAGSNVVSATYSGDSNYTGGENATLEFVADRATPGVSLATSSNPSVYGQSVTATATITPSDLAGSVQFEVDGVDLGSPVTVSSGSAQSVPLTDAGDPLPTGNTVVSAHFVPTDTVDYLNGSAGIEQVVDKAPPVVSLSALPTSSTFGDPVTFTAEVDGVPAGAAPTGLVAFQDDGASINAACDAAAVSTAAGVSTATCTTAGLTTGANTVTATYSGNTDYVAGVSATDHYTVSKATPGVDLTMSSNPSVFGQNVTATATITPSDLAGSVQFQVNGTAVGSPVTVTAGSAQSPTLTNAGGPLPAGVDVVSATFIPTDTSDYLNGAAGIEQIVDHATPVVTLSGDVNPSVYGQSTTALAAVTPSGVAGSVQFSVNGTDVGSPVTVSSGTAASPPLTDAGDPLSPGDNLVAATFTPTDIADYTTASSSFDQIVDKDATVMSITINPASITAVVAARAPGAGSPTGTVTFSVDGVSVGTATIADGTATLTDTTPAGSSHSVSSVYSGDARFTSSSTSTSRLDPTITATVTSAHPKTSFGWYNSPATVRFTCTTNGSPLTAACPEPVTLAASTGGQSVTRTITAADGGAATAVVNSINIDRVKPQVTVQGVRAHAVYDGTAPAVRCVGTDSLSGLATCRISTTTSMPSARDVRTTSYTLTATDKAGNSATAHGSFRVRGLFLRASSFVGGAYDVTIGHHYVVGFMSKVRPHYIDATPIHSPRPMPFRSGPRMTRAGHGLWTIRISITTLMRHHALWRIGVRSNGTLHVVTLRLAR